MLNPPSQKVDTDSTDSLTSLRPLFVQTVLITGLLLGLITVLATLFAEPTREFAKWIAEDVGYWGIFLGVIATDAFGVPIPPDTYLLVAVAADEPVWKVLGTIISGSLVSGVLAYRLGPVLTTVGFLKRRIDAFRPKGEALFRRYGVWTVVIAALSPIPFSLVCWFAGLYRMPFGRFSLATLARIPRFIAYYYLFVLGWSPVA